MSQKVTRKNPVTEEKEKTTESPVKDMKKKVAANAEKEKQVEKPAEKQADKVEKPKQTEKPAEKNDKQKQPDKPAEKNEKSKQPEKATNKPADKSGEKTDKKVENNGVDNKKTEKKEQEKKDDKPEKNGKADAKKNGEKSKQNGSKQNGDANGVEEASDDDVLFIPDDDEFPELTYDDTSDNEAPSPDALPGRSATRRSQVKATRTPETPQPAAEKPQENTSTDNETICMKLTQDPETPQPAAEKPQEIDPTDAEVKATPETPQPASVMSQENIAVDCEPKEKLLKLSEAPPTDRKLRSDDNKDEKKQETKEDEKKKEKDGDVVEIEDNEEPRKTDTNFSKSRVKVSPYRRSIRIHDQTTSSVMANYTDSAVSEDPRHSSYTRDMEARLKVTEAWLKDTEIFKDTETINKDTEAAIKDAENGLRTAQVILTPIALVPPYYSSWLEDSNVARYSGNNTTMEMDITESSSFAEGDQSLNDSSYLSGLRAIKGRRSYKPLKELALKHNRSVRSAANISLSDSSSRPTGTVVGRKRKPEEFNDSIEIATEAGEMSTAVHTKRMRLLDRIAQPFRRTLASTPLPNRRNPEIVGINTDLPLSAPVSSPETFDPETLKPAPAVTVTPPTPTHTSDDMDKKRCIVM